MLATIATAIALLFTTTVGLAVWIGMRNDRIQGILFEAVIQTHGSDSPYGDLVATWFQLSDIPVRRRVTMIRAGVRPQQAHSLGHLSNADLEVMAALR